MNHTNGYPFTANSHYSTLWSQEAFEAALWVIQQYGEEAFANFIREHEEKMQALQAMEYYAREYEYLNQAEPIQNDLYASAYNFPKQENHAQANYNSHNSFSSVTCPKSQAQHGNVGVAHEYATNNGQVFDLTVDRVEATISTPSAEHTTADGVEQLADQAEETDRLPELHSTTSGVSDASFDVPNLTAREATMSANLGAAAAVYMFHLQPEADKNEQTKVDRLLVDEILNSGLHTDLKLYDWLKSFDKEARKLVNNKRALKNKFHQTLQQVVTQAGNILKVNHQSPHELLEDVILCCKESTYQRQMLEEVIENLKYAKRLEVLEQVEAITRKALSGNFVTDETLEALAQTCKQTQLTLISSQLKRDEPAMLFARYLEEVEAEMEEEPFKFGDQAYDDILQNGWRKGEYMVVGAAPGTGKTALALNMMMSRKDELQRTKQKKKILFFSLELTDHHVCSRLGKIHLNNLASAIRNQNNQTRLDYIARARDHGEIAYDRALFRDMFSELNQNEATFNVITNCRTIEEIDNRVATERAMGHDIDFVVIDYLQMIESSRPDLARDKLALVNHTSKALRKIAQDYDTRVCALSLLRDGAWSVDNLPTGADLKESRQIEADADIILTLTKDQGVNMDNYDQSIVYLENVLENGSSYRQALNLLSKHKLNSKRFDTVTGQPQRLDVLHFHVAKYRNGLSGKQSKLGFLGALFATCKLKSNAQLQLVEKATPSKPTRSNFKPRDVYTKATNNQANSREVTFKEAQVQLPESKPWSNKVDNFTPPPQTTQVSPQVQHKPFINANGDPILPLRNTSPLTSIIKSNNASSQFY